MRELKYHKETRALLMKAAEMNGLERLKSVLQNDNALLFSRDAYICLHNIVEAVLSGGDIKESLKNVKNIYNSPVFAINQADGKYQIKNIPDFDKAMKKFSMFSNCLSAYNAVNTILAIVVAQVTGYEIEELLQKGVKHIEGFVEHSLKTNPAWNKSTLISKEPVLIVPVGAAGTGKSTFYRELSNVINISCDNIRYLLFKDFGPCFSSWESTLSWWVVNQLTDIYINKGYSVFYNGVNTDMEYRSPVTMENTDSLYAGIPYKIKLVYFEPPVKLNSDELKELKSINLWTNQIDNIELSKYSANVAKILELIKTNYQRTLSRTKEIAEGKKSQDPYDVLYCVGAAIVKLFVEQSFEVPTGKNVIIVPRKEIPDEKERAEFYRQYAKNILETRNA